MKNRPLLKSLFFLCGAVYACGKSGNSASIPAVPVSSISVSANDSLLGYPIDMVYIQEVNSTQTTLISGQYPDTSSKKGSLSIRLIGDTTGFFKGNNLLVTYTDGKGNVYYNTKDSANFVQLDKFPKTYNRAVAARARFYPDAPVAPGQ